MSNFFITSFAQAENENYVWRFHGDLTRAVRDRSGHEIVTEICRGGRGSANSDLVARAGVLVALCSPSYYADPGCGRDWALFQHRLGFVPAQRGPAPAATPVLVRWLPAEPPAGLPRAPVLTDPHDVYARKGLFTVIDDLGWNSGEYATALQELAERVCAGYKNRPPDLPAADRPAPPQAFPAAHTVPGPRSASPSAPPPQSGPRVFLSYAHAAAQPGHADSVLALADLLKRRGINARTDHEAAQEPQIWRLWMQEELDAADYILTVASPEYRVRAEQRRRGGVGLGVTWEGSYVLDEVYENPQTWVKRVIRVILPPYGRDDLPVFPGSASATYYRIDPSPAAAPAHDQLDALVRYLKRGPRPSP
ncbi:toll/interleukin-1 receptor domain-containing protein [Streptomyces justiciae]|uniref:Toll/interleukin-1 receptor domain-containing protein n=1 Tax=Streptomyces justiciae TaxID=2780140 RepID=A0ABU3M3Q3_9ACTN|nr:toll/interleukin-1 receptor domain-containing protein [Streptomyces justiciae]MDT7846136.1 toll/interleukin-1 receptor domain-containing protein [Streptomyces justiciae]